jgi:photosystem II stability/assembly factor-like uncharacterized protein
MKDAVKRASTKLDQGNSMSTKTFLAATVQGLACARSTSDGAWEVQTVLEEQDVRCLAADPLRAGVVYAGTQGNGVWRSDDAGRTWRSAGLRGQTIKALAVSRTRPGTVYAGTRPALLFVSHDAGTNWKELVAFRHIPSRWFWFSPAERPFKAYVQGLALSPDDPDTIVVGIEFGAVVRSSDGGRTWSSHRRGALRDCHSLIFHPTQKNWTYEAGGTGAGVAVSRDAGLNWTQPKDGLDRHYGWAVAADAARPEIWYASLSPGPLKAHSEHDARATIVRSTGGAEWATLAGGLPQPLSHMPYALLTDPEASGHVYAGLSNGDVWHSTNYGDIWQQLSFNLGRLRTMIILP